MKDENGENISQHKFGITSLINKRDLLQKDDTVVFKIDETNRAVEVSIYFIKISSYADYFFFFMSFKFRLPLSA